LSLGHADPFAKLAFARILGGRPTTGFFTHHGSSKKIVTLTDVPELIEPRQGTTGSQYPHRPTQAAESVNPPQIGR